MSNLPEIPQNYRWNLHRSRNQFVSKGYIDQMLLQKKFGPFWFTVASAFADSNFTNPEQAARKIMRDYFKSNDPNTQRLGVQR